MPKPTTVDPQEAWTRLVGRARENLKSLTAKMPPFETEHRIYLIEEAASDATDETTPAEWRALHAVHWSGDLRDKYGCNDGRPDAEVFGIHLDHMLQEELHGWANEDHVPGWYSENADQA